MTTKDGFYRNLTIEDYLALDALSKSGMVALSRSPAHYKQSLVTKKEAKHFDIGTAVHALVLEPERAESILYTPPVDVLGKGGTTNTNAYRAWAADLPAGAVILKADEMEQVFAMRDAVMRHPMAEELLTGGTPEVSMLWADGNGIRRKARPDYLKGAYVDVKTSRSADAAEFGRLAYNLKYHWSAAWTIDIGLGLGSTVTSYYFFVVESEAPYAVQVFRIPEKLIELGRNELTPVYHSYVACKEYDVWPGYSDEVQELTFPKWAMPKDNA